MDLKALNRLYTSAKKKTSINYTTRQISTSITGRCRGPAQNPSSPNVAPPDPRPGQLHSSIPNLILNPVCPLQPLLRIASLVRRSSSSSAFLRDICHEYRIGVLRKAAPLTWRQESAEAVSAVLLGWPWPSLARAGLLVRLAPAMWKTADAAAVVIQHPRAWRPSAYSGGPNRPPRLRLWRR